jgi:hypothetical protein
LVFKGNFISEYSGEYKIEKKGNPFIRSDKFEHNIYVQNKYQANRCMHNCSVILRYEKVLNQRVIGWKILNVNYRKNVFYGIIKYDEKYK